MLEQDIDAMGRNESSSASQEDLHVVVLADKYRAPDVLELVLQFR